MGDIQTFPNHNREEERWIDSGVECVSILNKDIQGNEVENKSYITEQIVNVHVYKSVDSPTEEGGKVPTGL